MAPRAPHNQARNRRQAVPPQDEPTAPSAPTRRSRTRVQLETKTSILQDEEQFDLDAISGSEDDYAPPHSDHGSDANSTAQVENTGDHVNDPDTAPVPKSTAHDILYFYDKSGDKVVCKICRKAKEADPSKWPSSTRYEYSHTTSTTSLRPHIEKHHLELYLTLAKEKGWNILLPGLVSQARSQATTKAATSEGGRPDKFDERTFHQHLMNFIVADDQSLNLMECREFRQLLLLLRNDLKEEMIPHRTKLRELIIQAWKQQFQVLRRDLAASKGQISITADVWSDQNRRPFLAMTAHWIAEVEGTTALQLKMALIAFHRLRGKHDGKTLAETVLRLLDRAQITVEVGHFTLDNAGNNGTMMRHLETMLGDRDIAFDAVDRKIMCFAHVVDLSSKQVTRNADNTVDDDGDGSLESDEETAISGPITRGRNVVRVIRGSGMRRDAFEEVIKDGNKRGWFKAGRPLKVVQIKPLQLLRDVRTRWDSIYLMLNRLHEMRPAIDHFLALPNNTDLAKYQISSQDWDSMRDIEFVLSVGRKSGYETYPEFLILTLQSYQQVPHVVQQVMSGESTPLLCGAIPAFEMFMTRWENIIAEHPRLGRLVRPGLDWAYKYYGRMDRTRAYFVAMLLNPTMRMSWIHKHWEAEFITLAETKIKQTMLKYREGSKEGLAPTPEVDAADSGTEEVEKYFLIAAQYGLDMDIGESEGIEQTVEQEYQAYITAPLSSKTVNILKFWEVNRGTFPTLFAMAMDYLPIQSSAVPCERIFSSSAETDTKRRNRISPLLMEALQMLKCNLKKERLNFTAAWRTAEKQMIDDGADGDLLADLLDGDLQDGLDRIAKFLKNVED